MKTNILLVEDESSLINSLGGYLDAEGFKVEIARTLSEARTAIKRKPHLILLDWMLPDGKGIDLLKEWRKANQSQPIIMLTAKSELVDKVLGLELGANDYITKPFEPRELLARINAHLRAALQKGPPGTRSSISTAKISIAGIDLDPSTREVLYKKKTVELTHMEFELLKIFLNTPNHVFSRAELLNDVWGYDNYPTTRTVDNHVSQLRKKISPELFEIVRRVGYRFVVKK